MTFLNSYMWKVGLAKWLGLAYGLAWFFLLPVVMPESDPLLRWGILAWAITMGGMIGMTVMARPRFGPGFSRIPNWILSAMLGAWMGVIMVLFAADTIAAMMAYFLPAMLQSPWLLCAETALLGIVIGWASSHAFNAKG